MISNRKKSFGVTAVIACCFGALALFLTQLPDVKRGDTGASPSAPEVITVGTSILPFPQPPSQLKYLEHFETQRVVVEPLLLRNSQDVPELRLAESIENEGSRLVVTLHRNARFSDGTKITSDDAIWSFTALLNSSIGESSVLRGCLGHEGLSGLTRNSEKSFSIGVSGCQSSRLVEELASPNYGIVKKLTYYDSEQKDLWSQPVSGMYLMQHSENGILFLPNQHHHLFDPASPPPVLMFRDLSTENGEKSNFNIKDGGLDLFKTVSAQTLQLARQSGYEVRISPPVMTWYLGSDFRSPAQERSPTDEFLKAFRKAHQLKLDYFDANPLESQANTFFPGDFGCDKPVYQTEMGSSQELQRFKGMQIAVHEHISGESNPFKHQLVDTLSSLGFSVDLSSKLKSPAPINLHIYRAFLGPDFLTTFQLLFNTFGTIRDPSELIVRQIEKFETVDKSRQQEVLSQMCKRLASLAFLPLAHRKIAFVASQARFLNLISPPSGYFSFASSTRNRGVR